MRSVSSVTLQPLSLWAEIISLSYDNNCIMEKIDLLEKFLQVIFIRKIDTL